jgi:hypothetical protein
MGAASCLPPLKRARCARACCQRFLPLLPLLPLVLLLLRPPAAAAPPNGAPSEAVETNGDPNGAAPKPGAAGVAGWGLLNKLPTSWRASSRADSIVCIAHT